MNKEDIKDLSFIIGSVVGSAIVLWLIVVALYTGITTRITETNLVRVSNNQEVVYEGKRAYTKIETGGNTTTVTIYRRLFPLYITEATYSSNEIIVIPVKE
jgi:hypothetical protein